MYLPKGRGVARFKPEGEERGCASEISGGIPSRSINAVIVPMKAWKTMESS